MRRFLLLLMPFVLTLSACGGGGDSALKSTGATAKSDATASGNTSAKSGSSAASPSSTTSTTSATSTTSGTTTTTIPAAPTPATFTGRTIYVGSTTNMFQVEITKASIDPASAATQNWKLVIEAKAKNYSTKPQPFDIRSVSVTYGSERADASPRSSASVPGGEASNVTFEATVKPSFKFADAALVVGSSSSNQAIAPLDSAKPVQTLMPIEGFIDGKVLSGGTGTTIKITNSILRPDFTDGKKGYWFVEIRADSQFASSRASDYDEVAGSLTGPDGTSAGPELSYIYAFGGINVLQPAPSTGAARFSVREPVKGNYKLTFTSRRVTSYKDAGAVHPTLEFAIN